MSSFSANTKGKMHLVRDSVEQSIRRIKVIGMYTLSESTFLPITHDDGSHSAHSSTSRVACIAAKK